MCIHIKELKDWRIWRIRSWHNRWIIESKATAPSLQFSIRLLLLPPLAPWPQLTLTPGKRWQHQSYGPSCHGMAFVSLSSAKTCWRECNLFPELYPWGHPAGRGLEWRCRSSVSHTGQCLSLIHTVSSHSNYQQKSA